MPAPVAGWDEEPTSLDRTHGLGFDAETDQYQQIEDQQIEEELAAAAEGEDASPATAPLGAVAKTRWARLIAAMLALGIAGLAGLGVALWRTGASPPAAPGALAGAWTGEALGQPLQLALAVSSAGIATGTAVRGRGAAAVTEPVSGQITLAANGGSAIELRETDGAHPATYTGRISPQEAGGQVLIGGTAQGTWTARR